MDNYDVFVHNRQTGETELISRHIDGVQGYDRSWAPSISADGRFVTFDSYASNLIDNDTNGESYIFVHDRQTETITLISRHTNGTVGNGQSERAAISADGRVVLFVSSADNLVDKDINSQMDIFVRERED